MALKLSSTALDTFGDPTGPVFLLPPLGLPQGATQVTRHGDTYSFVVPQLDLALGWVAYAPLSHAAPTPDNVALDTPARAQVVDGYVVVLALPQGVHAVYHADVGLIVGWRLSHFGTAPPVTNR